MQDVDATSNVTTERAGSDRRSSARHAVESLLKVAIFDGKNLPSASLFFDVQGVDLSLGGFSYWSAERPDYEYVVIALGTSPGSTGLTARVAHRRQDFVSDERRFLVGCSFVDRVNYAIPLDAVPFSPELIRRIWQKQRSICESLSVREAQSQDRRIAVHDVMSHDLLTVSPTCTISRITSLMNERHCRHIFVCEYNSPPRHLLGVVSDRDLHQRHGKTAAEVMTRNPAAIESDTEVFDALALLLAKRVSCLPVLDGEEVVGVVTTTDLMLVQYSLLLLQRADRVDEGEGS